MKIVTVCTGGIVRSVAMAATLKYNGGHDAIALSADMNSNGAFKMLCSWADAIILMEPHFIGRIPQQDHSKVMVCDVGGDVWCNPLHDDLLELCQDFAASKGLLK